MDINPRTTVTICTAPSRMDLHPAVGSNGPWMLRSVSPRPHCHEDLFYGGRPSGAGQAGSLAADAHAHAHICWEIRDIRSNRLPAGTGVLAAGSSVSHAHAITQIERYKCRGEPDPEASSGWQLDSWKSFLKIVLAYCMGYGKTVDVSRYVHGKSNREQLGTQQTNLTRRK